MEEKYYNIISAADLLGIKVRTAREWIRIGKIKAIKYPASNRWFISAEEIKRVRGEYSDDNTIR
jgi:predicted site-specific integrase-resolvase